MLPPLNRASATYQTPRLLQPIQLLDLLELEGTTAAAARALGISQPSVSRRRRQLVQELGIDQGPCLQLLRHACQAHRLEAGAWRLGSSPWLEAALLRQQRGRAVPARFRHPRTWRELVAGYVLDGALLSGLDLDLLMPELAMARSDVVAWQECLLLPVARGRLGLLLPPVLKGLPPRWSQVAVPPQTMAPGLAALVRRHQWQCLHAAPSCQSAPAWGEWLRQQNMPTVASPAWVHQLRAHLPGWHWQPWPGGLDEQHWLLVLESSVREQHDLQTLLSTLSAALTSDAVSESPIP